MLSTISEINKKHFEISKEAPIPIFNFEEFFTKNKETYESIGQSNSFTSFRWREAKEDIAQFENSRTLEQLGDAQLIRNNLARAKKHYLKAINITPSKISLYEKTIYLFIIEKNTIKAEKYFNKLLEVVRRRSDYLYKYVLFQLFFKNEHNDQSLKDLKEIAENLPDNCSVLNTMGFIYLKKNEINRAIECFKNALKINSNFEHSINNLGVCYKKKNEIEKSKKFFDLAIKKNPLYVAPYENIANHYLEKEEYKKAFDVLTAAVEKNLILSPPWQHQLGWLYIVFHKYERAIELYEKLSACDDKNSLIENNIGYCYIQIRKDKEAKNHFKNAIKIVEEKFKKELLIRKSELLPFYNIGRLAIKSGNLENIKRAYNQIAIYSPEDGFIDYLKGVEKIMEKKYGQAKEFFLKSLNKREDIPEIYPDLAFIFESIEEDYISAIKLLEKALQMGFKEFLIFNNLIYAYIENGDFEKAEKLLKIFNKKIPPIIYANKGLLSFRKKDIKNGNLFYEKAIKELPSDAVVVAKQYWLNEKCKYYIDNGNKIKAHESLILLKDIKQENYMSKKIRKTEEYFKSKFINR